MSQEEKFYIDILSDYKSNFKSHLDIQDNYRTIFSGIFGIGKTTFLKEFFDLEEIKEDYEVIHLFPVNYSIATNEDIFELIKFDIFYQLLSKNIEFDIESIQMDIVAYQFIKENFKEIIFPFLNFIPSVGGSIKEVAEKCIDLQKKFIELDSDINKDELKEVEKFLEDFSKKKGTIYENDFYSQLITSLIYKLKVENKKVVLIVDDLDRIDPEHIFRLLNIFSAHTDIQGDGSNFNKFDFDKVIFVCDVNNIRSIYQTKFGITTDFNGYIDKFYSKSIYNYNISNILKSLSRKMLEKFNNAYTHENLVGNGRLYLKFNLIIEQLFYNNLLSIRDLNRVFRNNNKIKFEIYELDRLGITNYYNTNFIVCMLYDILLYIYGNDPAKLLSSISKVNFKNTQHASIGEFIKPVAVIITLSDLGTRINGKNDIFSNQHDFKNQKIKLKQQSSHTDVIDCDIHGHNILSEEFNYFKLLYEAFFILSNKKS